MSDDDLLRERLRAIADDAGAHADPRAARRRIEEGPPMTPPSRPPLWLLGGLATFALVGGTVLGATALRPEEATSAASDAVASARVDARTGTTFDCPDGTPVGDLRVGDRVYVVGRDESASWAAIRDPRSTDEVVWVAAVSLARDTETDVPVVGCTEAHPLSTPGAPAETTSTTAAPGPSTTTAAPRPGPTTPPAPTTAAPKPGPTTTAAPAVTTTTTGPTTTTAAPDTQQPSAQSSSNIPEIYRSNQPVECAKSAALTVLASDNVGVTSVTGTWSGVPGSPLTFTRTAGTATNGTWTASFGPFNHPTTVLDVVITITVRDAAGNSRTTTVTVDYWNECLI